MAVVSLEMRTVNCAPAVHPIKQPRLTGALQKRGTGVGAHLPCRGDGNEIRHTLYEPDGNVVW
jgi:hypothetical protein